MLIDLPGVEPKLQGPVKSHVTTILTWVRNSPFIYIYIYNFSTYSATQCWLSFLVFNQGQAEFSVQKTKLHCALGYTPTFERQTCTRGMLMWSGNTVSAAEEGRKSAHSILQLEVRQGAVM